MLGSIDGFAPYWQNELFHRLRRHCRGTLYVIGLEPLPLSGAAAAATAAHSAPQARCLAEIARLRDVAVRASGRRPYREFPEAATHTLLAQAGFAVEQVARFPSHYSLAFVLRQVAVARNFAAKMSASSELRQSLAIELDQCEAEARALHWPATFGNDYIIVCHVSH